MKTKTLTLLLLCLLPFAGFSQSTVLTINKATGLINIPSGSATPNFASLKVGSVSLSFGSDIAAFLSTPSSANLNTALTDKTGSGVVVFDNNATLVSPILGNALATSIDVESITGFAAITGKTFGAGTGGTIQTFGTGGNGGGISTAATSSGNGGNLNLSSTTGADGGTINTSDGGGGIDTRGTGFIQLGTTGTRTTINGTATADHILNLPDSAGDIAVLTSITVTLALTNSGITPVADGPYTVGIGGTQNGIITITNGIITAVQPAIP